MRLSDGSTTSFSEWITEHRSELGAYSNEQVNSDSYERCFKQSLSLVPVRVLSVEPCRTDVDTYDIEVEGEHEFFCEGYLTHNSAQIAIGDPDDHLFLRAKNWAEGNIPNWRQMSNNSIYADSFDQISRDVWETGYQPDEKTGKAKGEPYGFINLPLSRKYGRLADGLMKDCKMYPTDTDNCEGVNPCLTDDTWILTSDGPRMIRQLVGKDFRVVHNGGEYKVISNGFLCTGKKKIFELNTDRGFALKLTENHKLLRNVDGVQEWVELTDLKVGDHIELQRHEKYTWGNPSQSELGWLLGNLVGDGTFTKETAILCYWGNNKREMLDYASGLLERISVVGGT